MGNARKETYEYRWLDFYVGFSGPGLGRDDLGLLAFAQRAERAFDEEVSH